MNLRSYEIDELMLDYNNSDDAISFINKYIVLKDNDLIVENLRKGFDMNLLSDEVFLKTFIRLFYFMNTSKEKFDENDFFDDYIATLYGYHIFDQNRLGDFSHLIRDAVSLWNGSPKEGYVYVNAKNEPVKIAYKLHYEIDSDFFKDFVEKKDAVLSSYSLSMKMSFRGSEEMSTCSN